MGWKPGAALHPDPAAFGLVAVGAAVGAGAGYVFEQVVTVVLQEGVEAGIETFAVINGLETGLERVC